MYKMMLKEYKIYYFIKNITTKWVQWTSRKLSYRTDDYGFFRPVDILKDNALRQERKKSDDVETVLIEDV